MERKSLISFFSIPILITTLLAQSFVVYSQFEDWLSIEDEFFIVKYKEGYRFDAELILEYCRFARNVTMKIYPHELNVKVKVYLYDYKSWKYSPYTTSSSSGNAEMYLLTPSDVSEQYRSWVDNLWYMKNIVHEYVHISTWRDIQKGWGASRNPPSWLMEGIAEYIAIFCTTKEILQKYSWNLKNVENMVRNGDGYLLIVSGDVYYGGAYILKYMYETYGKEKIIAFFKCKAKSFGEALKNGLGVTYLEFENNWLKWAIKEFDANPNLYISLGPCEEILLKYSKLFDDYQSLQSEYNDLKQEYVVLQSKYKSIIEQSVPKEYIYIFTLTTIIFIVTTILLLLEKYKFL